MFKYSKPISSVSCSSILYIFLFTSCMAFTCIHDNINEYKRLSGTQTRSVKFQDARNEKTRSPHQYDPLQIYYYGDNFNQTVSINTVHNVERAFQEVTSYIAKLLQVRKRKSPYVLERTGCTQRWQYGFNKGKCSRFANKTEICAVKDIFHVIPDRFLDSLDVFDFNSPRPILNISRGAGLQDANFILFITGQQSSYCDQTKDVLAFGSHCRVNPKTNEPLAGIINLCPAYFGAYIYPFNYYFNVLLHEMFHILGFSKSLFEKFIPCEKGIYCNMPKSAVQFDSNGTARLMYPMVIENAQKHFGCSEPDFGAPMDLISIYGHNTSDSIYSSHFHRLLMYSSIMMAHFTEFDELYVDNITLAVFASTGWYHVDFKRAEDFRFGEGEGCTFGLDKSCENSKFICDPKLNMTGCDVDLSSIGKCVELDPSLPCGIYRPKTEDDCEQEETSKQFALDHKALGYSLKCIRLGGKNFSESHPECLPVKCDSMYNFDVLVNLTWVPCFFSQVVTFKNFTLFCPESRDVCPTPTLAVFPQYCLPDQFSISIRMFFASPDYKILKQNHNFRNFKVTAIRGIARKMNIQANYIVNASLSVFKKIYLDFIICPPETLPPGVMEKLLKNVQSFLDSSNYLEILSSRNSMILASYNVKIDPIDVISFSDHEGFKALLIFPVICAIFLLATGVASLFRLFLIQRPKRQNRASKENNEMT